MRWDQAWQTYHFCEAPVDVSRGSQAFHSSKELKSKTDGEF